MAKKTKPEISQEVLDEAARMLTTRVQEMGDRLNPKLKRFLTDEFASILANRVELVNTSGFQYGRRRDMFKTLGYPRKLVPRDLYDRFRRGEVAARVVEAPVDATWRGTVELVENEDPNTKTPFEEAWETLNRRFNIWGVMRRADLIAGMNRFSVILIGMPGHLNVPADMITPNGLLTSSDLLYFTPYSEKDAAVETLDITPNSSRFGLPIFYTMTRLSAPLAGLAASQARRVHWSRVIHVAENLLDDHVYGLPRMERVWNRLDDLDKVAGGGSEAYWRRADPGRQWDIDPTLIPDVNSAEGQQEIAGLKELMEKFTHDLERNVITRGVTLKQLPASVSNFAPSVTAIMSLISAGTGIPLRILMGSEAGHLASTQDRENWSERISDRRKEFAEPNIVRPMVDRLINLGILPAPSKYEIVWPEIEELTEESKLDLAGKAADINQKMGREVITGEEIRDQYLGMPVRKTVSISPYEPVSRQNVRKWRAMRKRG